MSTPRPGMLTWPRRLLAWAIARDLTTFVVPDMRLARAAGLALEAAGLRPVATPRHATVLLLVGPMPDALASAAGIVYTQMPRPRAILAAGISSLPGLPEPDIVTPLEQNALQAGVTALRRKLAESAFAPDVTEAEIAAVQTHTEYVCPMHPEIVRDEPGSCPICGMNLVPVAGVHDGTQPEHEPRPLTDHGVHAPAVSAPDAHGGHQARHAEQAAEAAVATGNEHEMNHGSMAHEAMSHTAMDQSPPGNGMPEYGEHGGYAETANGANGATMEHVNHASMDHGSDTDAVMAHGEMDHGMMDHSVHGGGFMSMVAMTEHLPRSDDGLPMEWIEVPFGPLFPGLPGGLDVTFTLDGDGVARAAVAVGATARGLEAIWAGPVETFPARLARVDPLAPIAYRILAQQALAAVAGVVIDERVARARIRDAEWERVGSHLGWLASFASLIGDAWLAQRAAALQLAVARTTGDVPTGLTQEIRDFLALASGAPLIDHRLAGIGETGTEEPHRMRGPVARAAGIATDARSGDVWYQALAFTPVIRTGGDALARLQVRLAEIAASLDLLVAVAAGDRAAYDVPLPSDLSGAAEATLETPRGAAQLRIVAENGSVVTAHLDSPSAVNIRLVPDVIAGQEVADALVAVASLDLSPWEVDR